jgi:hypothetical protein
VRLLAVLLVTGLFHPVDDFAVELFLNRDVSHGGSQKHCRCSVRLCFQITIFNSEFLSMPRAYRLLSGQAKRDQFRRQVGAAGWDEDEMLAVEETHKDVDRRDDPVAALDQCGLLGRRWRWACRSPHSSRSGSRRWCRTECVCRHRLPSRPRRDARTRCWMVFRSSMSRDRRSTASGRLQRRWPRPETAT